MYPNSANVSSVSVFGLDPVSQASEVRKIISYLPEEAGAYPNLSGWEYLQFMSKFIQGDSKKAVAEAAEISDLATDSKTGQNLQQRNETTIARSQSSNGKTKTSSAG